MRYSKMLIPTLKEAPADAVVLSHVLMLRAGLIRKVAAGIYNYLPLALRTIKKIEDIIREEMNRSGALELLMPMVQPAELWEESGRWAYYGPELLRFNDRKEARFCLGPTHEEVITHIVRSEVRSYRSLPLNLYQIQTKFRDEIRPRFGLMRGREFIMKDAYSFDLDEEGAGKSYRIMYDTYKRIFSRFGLRFKAVEAGTGAIGGTLSHEFQVLAENGEDAILSCSHCEYAANLEKAECLRPQGKGSRIDELPLPEEVSTPDKKTIEEVSGFLNITPERLCKTLIYMTDKKPVIVLIRGDHELADTKLMSLLKCDEFSLAENEVIERITGAPLGFAGPLHLKEEVPVYADYELAGFSDGVTGANKKDAHLIHIFAERDFPETTRYADLRQAREGEPCPRCGKGVYEQHRGIEVGQVFYLGTKYSERMNATVLDEKGETVTLVMGCYGIGVTRSMAAAIEQNHDQNGIIWPMPIAPFQVIICPVGSEEKIKETSEDLYGRLLKEKVEVILDDRNERPGVMFKDADLTGIPIRITIGKRNLDLRNVEVKLRREKEGQIVPLENCIKHIKDLILSEMDV
jgi:prolyl-tRNA synthetase